MGSSVERHVHQGLAALGVDGLAAITGVRRELLLDAQVGRLDGWSTADEARLVRGLGLDIAAAEVTPGEETPAEGGGLLAFLRDRWGGLLAGDLVAIQRALTQARFLSREGLLRAGPRYKTSRGPRTQAWKAGYLLAQRLRRDLGLGAEPLPALRPLVEERLGVWIARMDLATPGLEALAVAQDPTMVIVLQRNPRRPDALERRSIAHELGHLLFDPRAAGRVGDTILGPEDADPAAVEPREQRARAFAAELLLPSAALRAAWGDPTEDPLRAQERLGGLCATFGAPWELAVHHLHNHGHLSAALRETLLRVRPGRVAAPGLGPSPAMAALRAQVAEGEHSGGRVRDLFGPGALDEAP